MASFNDLLNHAKSLDAKIAGKKAKLPSIPKETLFDGDDEFSGNDNNRKVADRKTQKPADSQEVAQAAANAGIVGAANSASKAGTEKDKAGTAATAAAASTGSQNAGNEASATAAQAGTTAVPTWIPNGSK